MTPFIVFGCVVSIAALGVAVFVGCIIRADRRWLEEELEQIHARQDDFEKTVDPADLWKLGGLADAWQLDD